MLAPRSDGIRLVPPQRTSADTGHLLMDEKGVRTAAFDISANTNDTLRYGTYALVDDLHSLILNGNIYLEDEECFELAQYPASREKLSQVFQICRTVWLTYSRLLFRNRLDTVFLSWTRIACR